MYRLGNPYTLALLGVATMLFALAAVTARSRHDRRVALPLAGFLAAVGLLAFGDSVRIAAPNRAHILFWNKVAYVGVVALPPTYFFFIAAITNRERWFRRHYVAGMVAISLAVYVLILTNRWHHLWIADRTFSPGTAPPVMNETWGLLWYPWVLYGTGLVSTSGVYFLASDLARSSRSRLYRSQVALVLLAILVPWFANILFVGFDVVAFDLFPFTLWITGTAFAVAIFKFDLLDIRPIARDVVVENVDAGVLVLDSGNAVVDANDRARDVLDIDEETIPGAAVDDVLSDAPGITTESAGTGDGPGVMSVETGDGRRHFEVDVSPIEDDLGTSLGRAIVFTDVTDRIERELTLRERTAELRRRNERLDELASVVSHDLRNPLDVTAKRARHLRTVLDETDLSPATRSALEDEIDGIERATERASEITGELLTITRDGDRSRGRTDSDPGGDAARESGAQDPTSLRAVATAAWDTVETGDLELSIRGSHCVAADDSDLRRLFENCFRNVVEHADGATEVVVGATGEGFYVADDGAGIAADDRTRVFERGYSTAADSEGLGLAVVADVADDHGWTVALGDSESGGLRLTVELDPEGESGRSR